jgi:lactoylglutathione lyase
MRLAKQHLDVGLFTNNIEPMLDFWQNIIGLAFEEGLPTGGGNMQHRHALNGGVLKVNHVREPMEPAAPSGYRRLMVASTSVQSPKELRDPDNNHVLLVPPGHDGIGSVGIELAVTSLAAARQYYLEALEWDDAGPNAVHCGQTTILLREDPDAAPVGPMRSPGYRYLTVQVWDADAEYARIVERGGEGAMPPRTLGNVARFGFVRDPDGNWLEISQRASLTGPLPQN